MPRTREQFAQMKDERRESILEAALPLFSLYKKVSIDDICSRLNCSHGIVYHYFKNSAQIYEKLLKSSTYVELQESLFQPKTGSSYEKIEEIVGILLDISEKDLPKIAYANILLKSREKDSLFAILTKLVKDAQTSQLVKGGEPAKIVETLFLLLKGIYVSFLLEKHPDIKVPSLETVMELLRKPTNFSRQIL